MEVKRDGCVVCVLCGRECDRQPCLACAIQWVYNQLRLQESTEKEYEGEIE